MGGWAWAAGHGRLGMGGWACAPPVAGRVICNHLFRPVMSAIRCGFPVAGLDESETW
jgi:hypothetical protein